MFIYSETARAFLKKVQSHSSDILNNEMSLRHERKRVHYKNKTYPLNFVIFEHPKILGEYCPMYFQIKINKKLIYKADTENLKNIIRHELCHFYTHLIFGANTQAHGKEFNSVCQSFNYGVDVSSSTIELDSLLKDSNHQSQEQKILFRIKKLMALSKSPNLHEATLATKKANELLIEHNLQDFCTHEEKEEDETFLLRVLPSKRLTPKLSAIYNILHHFFVAPVISYGNGICYLELIGTRENVLCAEYIANFFNSTFESLYNQEKNLKGARAKKSFMVGLSEGFIEKLKNNQTHEMNERGLINLKNQLSTHLNRVYPKLRGRATRDAPLDELARKKGQTHGRSLSISKALSKSKGPKQIEFRP